MPTPTARSRTKDKGRGAAAPARGAQRATRLYGAAAQRHGPGGAPHRAADKRQGLEAVGTTLAFWMGAACGETRAVPYWVGAGAAARGHKKWCKSFVAVLAAAFREVATRRQKRTS